MPQDHEGRLAVAEPAIPGSLWARYWGGSPTTFGGTFCTQVRSARRTGIRRSGAGECYVSGAGAVNILVGHGLEHEPVHVQEERRVEPLVILREQLGVVDD